MTVVLTICSANYLAMAKTFGDSLAEHNENYQFVIGLVDRIPEVIDATYWEPYELIPVEAIGIENFDEMAHQYNIIELNTAVKPFYMEYLYNRNHRIKNVIYFDPDILILGSLKYLEENLERFNIVLTPHRCSYDDTDENINFEVAMLLAGTYNLGFIATSRTAETLAFLKWWQKRLRRFCYSRAGQGCFYDQIWANLAPVFFRKVRTETNPGYNMCYWNLFERSLSKKDGRYLVNDQHELIFYHFSSYSPMQPELVTTRAPVKSLADYPELQLLFDDYRRRLLANQYLSLNAVGCYFMQKQMSSQEHQFPRSVGKAIMKNVCKKALMTLPDVTQRFFRRAAQFIMTNTHA